MNSDYDILIIGGGPAGLTAGIYACRAGWRTLLLEKGVIGGQISFAPNVENYPGFVNGVPGIELADLMKKQAVKFGLKIENSEAQNIDISGESRIVKSTIGDFSVGAVIVAGGAAHRRLGIPGEKELVGKGVSFCATCDAVFFRGQTVAVVGGGNSAVEEALFLTRFAAKVYLIHRRGQLRADRILQDRALNNPAIEPTWDSIVERVEGDPLLQNLKLRNVKTGAISDLPVTGVFISTGFEPDTAYLTDLLPLDPSGHIVVNDDMETGVPGLYAAGDIRRNATRQAVTAAGDGAVAAKTADKHLSER